MGCWLVVPLMVKIHRGLFFFSVGDGIKWTSKNEILQSHPFAAMFSARLDRSCMGADNRLQRQMFCGDWEQSGQMKCVKVIIEDNADRLWNSGKQLQPTEPSGTQQLEETFHLVWFRKSLKLLTSSTSITTILLLRFLEQLRSLRVMYGLYRLGLSQMPWRQRQP